MAFFDFGNIRWMLGLPIKSNWNHPASIHLLQGCRHSGTHETLKSRGVRFILGPHLVAKMPDYDLWLADFYDSEDNVLALMSEVPRGS